MAKIDKVQEVAIEKLLPYGKNAKIHSEAQVEQIAKSIKEFGFISPCLVDKDLNVIAGHGRIEACKKLGVKKIPCVFVEGLTEEQRIAYTLIDNKLTMNTGFDFELLSGELDKVINLDMTDFGFTSVELDGFFDEDLIDTQEDRPEPDKADAGRVLVICKTEDELQSVLAFLEGEQIEFSHL